MVLFSLYSFILKRKDQKFNNFIFKSLILDPDYLTAFLLTYQSFTEPSIFLNLLIERFQTPIPIHLDSIEAEYYMEKKLKPLRNKFFFFFFFFFF